MTDPAIQSGQEPSWYPSNTAPQPHDVVWCRFPFNDVEGFKDRPCLVRDVLEDEGERAGQIWLEVAYGTSQVEKNKRGPGSFCILQYAELQQIGLHKNTKFELFKTQLLPWAHEHFPNAPGKATPVVGRLTLRQMVRLQEFQKRMAENIAALEKGEERQEPPTPH